MLSVYSGFICGLWTVKPEDKACEENSRKLLTSQQLATWTIFRNSENSKKYQITFM